MKTQKDRVAAAKQHLRGLYRYVRKDNLLHFCEQLPGSQVCLVSGSLQAIRGLAGARVYREFRATGRWPRYQLYSGTQLCHASFKDRTHYGEEELERCQLDIYCPLVFVEVVAELENKQLGNVLANFLVERSRRLELETWLMVLGSRMEAAHWAELEDVVRMLDGVQVRVSEIGAGAEVL